MRDEAWASIGLEHAVRQRVLTGQRPVRDSLVVRHIGIGHVRDRIAAGMGKTVILSSIPVRPPTRMTMVNIGWLFERNWLQRDDLPVVVADNGGVCARKAAEEVIEGPVLLYDNDNVLNMVSQISLVNRRSRQ